MYVCGDGGQVWRGGVRAGEGHLDRPTQFYVFLISNFLYLTIEAHAEFFWVSVYTR